MKEAGQVLEALAKERPTTFYPTSATEAE